MPTESPDGTKARMIVVRGATWTIEGTDVTGRVLRDGRSAAGGAGSILKRVADVVYTLGTDEPTPQWYRWDDPKANWVHHGQQEPGIEVPPALEDLFVGVDPAKNVDEMLALLTKMRAKGYGYVTEKFGTAFFEKGGR